ncbi:MAG: tetratricopeptide repeat protein [Microcoleus sp.]
MPKQGKGEKSWQRVIDLFEALLDYALNDTNRISHLHAEWKGDTELHVTATLEALRHLLKEKGSFKPSDKTSDTQVKKYIGEVLTKYLTEELKILDDHRPPSKRKGNPNWNFTLKLWKEKDKTANLEELAKAWGGISIQINSRQNTEEKTESNAAVDSPPDKSIRVAVSQMPESVPVWKGRDELVAKLTAKLVPILPDGTSSPKVLAIVGQGGMGKTSLAIKLVEELGMNWQHSVSQAGKSFLAGGCECVMYFKAKEGTSFDDVAGFLLSEGLGIPGAAELKKPEEKIAKIILGLQQTRCLLILDNLEDILYPAVEAENLDSFDSSQIHRTISPDWGKLLNALVYQQHQSQTILTSRELPGDLADTRYPGLAPDAELVHIEVLQGVDERASVEILQRQLTDKLADLQWMSGRVEGHLFLLTQLVSLGKGKPGYLRKHPELVTKKVEPMLREQMARQSAAARDLVSRMCVLRVPIDVRGLTFLRLYADDWEKDSRFEVAAELEKPAELTDAEIEETSAILERLVGANLVQSRYDEDKCENFYDLHRVIEEFLQGEYRQELPQLLESVYKFYCTGKNVDNPQSLADLQSVLEAQHFAFRLGNYEKAFYLIPDEYLRRWGYWNLSKELYEQVLPYVEGYRRSYCLRELGAIHRDFGDWDLAEKYLKDALAIAEEDDNQSSMATSLGMLGDIERKRGKWDEAERLYRQCLEVETELGDRAGMASCWGVLGDIERNRGNWDEAERLYRQSLALRTELGDRAGMASSWGLLGYIEQCRGNWDEAERLYRQCLALRTELGDRAGMASSWGLLGYIEQCRGNWDEAERLYRQCLALMTELGDRAGMASSWGVLGDIERKRGNWDEAERLYRQSLALRTELGDRAGMASSWGLLGYIEQCRGNWDEAERLYRQCLALMTELGDRAGMASSWGVLGDIERKRGNWDEAERLYRQCLALRTELGDRAGMASSWGLLGYIEQCRGNWDEAERLYRQCLALMTELGDRAGMASSWGVLGDIERKRGNWDEAERLYRQSLALRTELGDRAGMASSWGLLGYIEQCRGNWDEAERLYRQCLALMTELGDRAGMASSWGVLGDIERKRGNWDEAERLYRQSLEVETELGDRAGMASSWGVLGDIERKRGNWDEAERLYRQSLALRTELGDREGIATSIGCLGENELGRGNLDTAEQHLTEALDKMQTLGMTWHIAETNYDFARLHRQRGNTEVAQQHYDTAYRIFQQLGAAKDLEKIEKEWHNSD